MSKERELLERWVSQFGNLRHDFNLLTKTKELLAQPEHIPDVGNMVEPVAWLHEGLDETGEPVRSIYHHFYEHANLIPLYTAPTKREPLSDEEIYDRCCAMDSSYTCNFIDGVEWAEQQHGIGVDDE